YVGLERPSTAEPLKFALLQHAQELRLHGGTHLAHFVEKQRPSGALLQPARPRRHGPGEGALLVPKQLRLEQRLRERRAVQRDERPLRAPRPAVDQVRHDLLAGPRLAGEEHRRLSWGHFRGLTQHVAPGFRGADRRVTALGLEPRREASDPSFEADGPFLSCGAPALLLRPALLGPRQGPPGGPAPPRPPRS